MNKTKLIQLSVIIVFLFSMPNFSYCESESQDAPYHKEFGIFSGWASARLKHQDDMEMIPLHFQFGFDVKPLFQKVHINPTGEIKFLLEPLLNTILKPDENIETGCNFMLKYEYPLIKRIDFYVEGGLGLLYSTLHTYEQATQFNFSEQFGGGLSFSFLENKTINMGYRYRHFSNADIEEPNGGIETDYFLCGLTVAF